LFQHAIVRAPGANFVDGLTTADLGTPDPATALAQHAAYCRAMEQCGLQVTRLDADCEYPDSTFVEDTAVLTRQAAIFTRPGAPSRRGEVGAIRPAVERFYSVTYQIEADGTLDGGDICEADSHVFIGVSRRTNEEGARQLAEFLASEGYTSSTVDIRGLRSVLHLKSGLAYLDRGRLVAIDELAGRPEFARYELIHVPPGEGYACNCVLVNGRVLLPAGFPGLEAELRRLAYDPLLLDMSEFRKMDGGLSCLSLRF
jgi:dimethylargininase